MNLCQVMYALQNQNVERKLVKKFDIKHLAREPLANESLSSEPLSKDIVVDINISEKDLKNETKFEDIVINIVENNLKTEKEILESNFVSEKDLKTESTNISDIPAILMEPTI